nr:hypothetical protein [Clostridioides difficile]
MPHLPDWAVLLCILLPIVYKACQIFKSKKIEYIFILPFLLSKVRWYEKVT